MKNRFFITFLLMILLCFMAGTVFAADYKISDYKIDAIIKENGDMEVSEYLVYSFSEDMNGVFRDILYKYNYDIQGDSIEPTSSRYQASGLDNIRAYYSDYSFDNMNEAIKEDEYKLSNGVNGYYSLQRIIDDGYREKIKLYSPVNSGHKKYIKYTYTLKDVAVKYIDAGEIFWNFLGGDWECSISNLDVNVKLENGDLLFESPIAYAHTYANIGSLNYINNCEVSFSVKNISSNTAVDLRFLFDVRALSDVTKNYNENYDFEELNAIEIKEAKKIENHKIANFVEFILVVLVIPLFIILIIIAKNKMKKYIKRGKEIEYFTDIPNNLSLIEYMNLDISSQTYTSPNYMLATILNLVNKKIIIMDARKKSEISFDNNYDYYMKINEKNIEKMNKLSSYERYIINWIFNKKMSDSIKEINIEEIELNARFKEISKSTSEPIKFHKYTSKKSEGLSKKLFERVNTGIMKIFTICLITWITLFIFIVVFVDPSTDKGPLLGLIPMIYVSVIEYFILYQIEKKPRDEYINDYYTIKGLRRYLSEYSLIKDRYPIEIALWDEYMIYATLLGIAKNVSKEMEADLVSQGYDSDYICSHYPFIYVGINSYSITSSISSSTTGSSSSGGYSGGGGGGGGRWWWRRSLLN